jgi:iron complex transport system ATP-binding protein
VILEIRGVSFKYNSRPVLRDIRFALAKAEVLAILGPNGVGKTTMLKCINAILRPGRGSVLVEGRDVFAMDSMEIARSIGYVAQRTEVARLTAFDAILLGRLPHGQWRSTRADLMIVDAAVKRLGLQDLAMRYVDQMSGGELQRVAIARALVQEPKLLLFDEPTSSLDLKNQVEILNIIRRVVREHDVAAVMTMHDLNTALRYADKFLFLKGGTVYAAGDVSSISEEMIQEVYGIPVEIHLHKGNPIIMPRGGDCKPEAEDRS